MKHTHKKIRAGDEYHCSCGVCWDVRDDDPHDLINIKSEKVAKRTDTKVDFNKLREIIARSKRK